MQPVHQRDNPPIWRIEPGVWRGRCDVAFHRDMAEEFADFPRVHFVASIEQRIAAGYDEAIAQNIREPKWVSRKPSRGMTV
jgi:hypothetical protein